MAVNLLKFVLLDGDESSSTLFLASFLWETAYASSGVQCFLYFFLLPLGMQSLADIIVAVTIPWENCSIVSVFFIFAYLSSVFLLNFPAAVRFLCTLTLHYVSCFLESMKMGRFSRPDAVGKKE